MSGLPENLFVEAVRHYGASRQGAITRQQAAGSPDQGLRGAVTAGGHMDGFIREITSALVNIGKKSSDIYTHRRINTIPGFFRPTKDWDLLVVEGGHLRAVLELKAQAGPSFGNNYNNRVEESIGNAVDLWTAYREGAFKMSPQPWLGYLFLLEDTVKTRTPVRVGEHHFPVFPEFVDASYAQRYELLCRKLVRERQYSASCFMLSKREAADDVPNYTAPAEDLTPQAFLSDMLRHLSEI